MSKLAGKFIVLDGPDGCGKSTQVKMLLDYITSLGVDYEQFRDPGTTAIGEKIRDILLDPEHAAMTDEVEVLLYMAARVQLWREKIAPALKENKCVVLDRWLSSTCAYQGHAGEFGINRVIKIAQYCLQKPWPDLTIVLDVNLKTAAKRLDRDLDRMEQKGDNYHIKVREGFLKLVDYMENVAVIDSTLKIDAVHKEVITAIQTCL